MSPTFRGTTTVKDRTCPNHPYREVAFRGDLCSICRSYRRERFFSRTPRFWPWALAIGALILLSMAVSMALAEHIHIEMLRLDRAAAVYE